MLTVDGIDTYYGLSHILSGVSLTVAPGEVVCLLGRNGAGKTTTMRSIMGLTPARRGSIRFKGQEIARKKPYQIARLGVGFVPDDRVVFADLTVDENLEISQRPPRSGSQWDRRAVCEFFPPLGAIGSRRAGFLSGGEQQMLTIARALVTNPEFLLLDEPTEGLAPLIVGMLEENIGELKARGLTILLAEQNQKVALGLSDRAYVIDNGTIRFHGTIPELQASEDVRRKYLLV
ncbi:MAG: ABC transporter ATP-binding protein [Deltaproteobacteria bacterium]|nr:ABC transporter ATP-binding protein [Deltaproteobacteria bacterium]